MRKSPKRKSPKKSPKKKTCNSPRRLYKGRCVIFDEKGRPPFSMFARKDLDSLARTLMIPEYKTLPVAKLITIIKKYERCPPPKVFDNITKSCRARSKREKMKEKVDELEEISDKAAGVYELALVRADNKVKIAKDAAKASEKAAAKEKAATDNERRKANAKVAKEKAADAKSAEKEAKSAEDAAEKLRDDADKREAEFRKEQSVEKLRQFRYEKEFMSNMSQQFADTGVPDYYKLIGVSNREATTNVIVKAIRLKMFAYHPDRNPSDKVEAAKMIELLGLAKELFSLNWSVRKMYDESLADAESGRMGLFVAEL